MGVCSIAVCSCRQKVCVYRRCYPGEKGALECAELLLVVVVVRFIVCISETQGWRADMRRGGYLFDPLSGLHVVLLWETERRRRRARWRGSGRGGNTQPGLHESIGLYSFCKYSLTCWDCQAVLLCAIGVMVGVPAFFFVLPVLGLYPMYSEPCPCFAAAVL